MTFAKFAISSLKDHPVPAPRAPAHQEKTVHKIMLAATAAMGLLIPAGGAFANDADAININTKVTGHCAALASNGPAINLGDLTDGNGFLSPSVLSGDETSTTNSFWCNSPVAITLKADALQNTSVPSIDSTTAIAFTRVVDYTATLVWDDVNGADASANPAATAISATEANIGNLVLKVTALNTPPKKLIAGNYAGAITVTFTLP